MLRNRLLPLSLFIYFIFYTSVFAGQKVTGNLEVTGNVTIDTLTSGGTQCAQLTSAGTISGTGSACGGSGSTPGGGQNAVQYNNSSTFTGNEALFSFNGSNIGIGTTNGNALLDISSTLSQDLFAVRDNGFGDATSFLIDRNGNVGVGTLAPQALFEINSLGTQDSFNIRDNGIQVLIVQDGGNVGIGTNTPGKVLDLSGSERIIGTNGLFFGSDNKVDIEASATTTPDLLIKTNSAETARFTNAGNIGIGTFNPTALVHAFGNGSSSTTIKAQNINAGGNAINGAINDLGKTVELISTGSTFAIPDVQALGASSNILTFFNNGGTIVSSMVGNNVGIGSLTPNAQLNVVSTTASVIERSTLNSALGQHKMMNDNLDILSILSQGTSNNTAWVGAESGAGTQGVIADNDLFITAGQAHNASNANFIRFGVNTVDMMHIEGTGNVSIGSTNAVNHKLWVTGDVLATSGYIAQTGTGYSMSTGTNTTIRDPSSAPNDWSFINSNTETMRLTTGNNVGIGSASPGTKLDVAGTTRQTGFILTGNGAASGFILQASGSAGIGTWVPSPSGGGGSGTINSGTTNRAARYTGATTLDSSVKIFDDATNVGIGTIAPRTAVELGVRAVNIVGSNVGVGTINPQNTLAVNGTVSIGSNYATVAGIANSLQVEGNIGIGSTAPGTALDVNGVTRISNSGDSYFGGNVGIGTTIPMNTVSVQGSLAVGTVAYTGTAAGTNNAIFSGNVGIGSTNPGQNLDVFGQFRVIGGSGTVGSVKTGANTACTTTCGGSKCLLGEDTSVIGTVVACTDATADVCVCLGP